MNRQSAKIVVVQDAETRARLTRMNAAVMDNTGDPMYGAPTILVVLAGVTGWLLSLLRPGKEGGEAR